ncbi:serine proteinase stubble [Trichonephila clavipes]|nr:serine proteinase stubble [Trichonephila clavipes]
MVPEPKKDLQQDGGAIPNLLQEVQVPIMSNSECVDMFKDAGHKKLIKPTFMCAGYKAGGKDSCEVIKIAAPGRKVDDKTLLIVDIINFQAIWSPSVS